MGTIVFIVCIYNIWRWTRRKEVAQRLQQFRQERQANIFYPLFRSIGIMRGVWYCAGCAALIIMAAAASSLASGWKVGLLTLGFIALYIVNNLYVTRRWRCPRCGERLPCIVGRSALRPKWTESCPHCDYGNT